jgi:hypothetical protein
MDQIIEFYDLFTNGPLMDDLLDERIDQFGSLFWTLIGLTLGGAVLYYYGLNHKVFVRANRFGKVIHWVLALIVTAVLVFVAHFVTLIQQADKQIPRNPQADPKTITYFFDEGDAVFFAFAGQVAGLSVVLFFLLSMAMKWGSTHAKNVPF